VDRRYQRRSCERVSVVPRDLACDAFAAFLGPGLDKVVLALVITGWAGYARVSARASLESKGNGLRAGSALARRVHTRILLRHILPNAIQPVLIQATIGMAGAILAESTLSFLAWACWRPRQVGRDC